MIFWSFWSLNNKVKLTHHRNGPQYQATFQLVMCARWRRVHTAVKYKKLGGLGNTTHLLNHKHIGLWPRDLKGCKLPPSFCKPPQHGLWSRTLYDDQTWAHLWSVELEYLLGDISYLNLYRPSIRILQLIEGLPKVPIKWSEVHRGFYRVSINRQMKDVRVHIVFSTLSSRNERIVPHRPRDKETHRQYTTHQERP